MSVVYFNGPVQNGDFTLAGRPGKAAGIRLADGLRRTRCPAAGDGGGRSRLVAITANAAVASADASGSHFASPAGRRHPAKPGGTSVPSTEQAPS